MPMVAMETMQSYISNPEKSESHAKAVLEMKYQKKFEITKINALKFNDGYYEVQAYAIDEPEMRFWAAVDMEDDNVSDSYVERRICEMISQKAAENLDGLPGYYYLYTYASGPQPAANDVNISIQDYVALDPNNDFRIELFVCPENSDVKKMYICVAKMLKGLQFLPVNATLYLMDEKNMAGIQAYLEDGDANVRTFSYKNRKKGFYSFVLPYEKGILEVTESEFISRIGGAL